MAEMDHLQPPQGQGKRARNTYDKKEKEIFLSILKTRKGESSGKLLQKEQQSPQYRELLLVLDHLPELKLH